MSHRFQTRIFHMKNTILLLALMMGVTFTHAAKPPNIVFIMADDLGYTDVATFGSKYYETPNIDRLATQGMKLTPITTARIARPRARR